MDEIKKIMAASAEFNERMNKMREDNARLVKQVNDKLATLRTLRIATNQFINESK